MTSTTFAIFLQAMKNKLQISCIYQGLRREICPHPIGWGANGEEMVLEYQFSGESAKGLPPNGEWRCFKLKEVYNAITKVGDWHTGGSHIQPQTCVKLIDFEVRI